MLYLYFLKFFFYLFSSFLSLKEMRYASPVIVAEEEEDKPFGDLEERTQNDPMDEILQSKDKENESRSAVEVKNVIYLLFGGENKQ